MRVLLQSLLFFGTIQASSPAADSSIPDDDSINNTPPLEPIISTSDQLEREDQAHIIPSSVSRQNLQPTRSRFQRSAESTTSGDVAISSGNTISAPSVIVTSLIGGFAALTLIFIAFYLRRRKKPKTASRPAGKPDRSTRKRGRSTEKERKPTAPKANDIDLEAARPTAVQAEKPKRPDRSSRPNQPDRPTRPTRPDRSNEQPQPDQPIRSDRPIAPDHSLRPDPPLRSDRPPRPERPAEPLEIQRVLSRPSNFSRPLSRGLPSRPRRTKSADAISRIPLPTKDADLPPLPPLQPNEARRPLSKRAEAIRRPTSDRLPDPRRSRSADAISRKPMTEAGNLSRPASRGKGDVPPVPPMRAMEGIPPVPPVPAVPGVPGGDHPEALRTRTEYFPYVPPSRDADEIRKALLGGLPVNPRPSSRKSEGPSRNARGREGAEVARDQARADQEEDRGGREGREGEREGEGAILRRDDESRQEDAMPAPLARTRSIRPASSIYPEDSIERMPSMRSTRGAGKTQSRVVDGLQRQRSDRTPYRLTYF